MGEEFPSVELFLGLGLAVEPCGEGQSVAWVLATGCPILAAKAQALSGKEAVSLALNTEACQFSLFAMLLSSQSNCASLLSSSGSLLDMVPEYIFPGVDRGLKET